MLSGAAAAILYFQWGGLQPGGAGGADGPVSESMARGRLEDGWQTMASVFGAGDRDPELRKATLTQAATGSSTSPASWFEFGAQDVTFEFGQGDRVRIGMHGTRGAVSLDASAVCTPERVYVVVGGETFALRPSVAKPSQYDVTSAYLDTLRTVCGQGPSPFPNGTAWPPEGFEPEKAVLDLGGDGSVRATFDVPATGHYEMDLGADGRLRSMKFDGVANETTGAGPTTATMVFEYGPRPAIDVPSSFKLLPASIELDDEGTRAGQRNWTVQSSPNEPPLGEIEARVAGATFQLAGAGAQAAGNLSFTFTDADGDGKVSAGDRLALADRAAQAAHGCAPGYSEHLSENGTYCLDPAAGGDGCEPRDFETQYPAEYEFDGRIYCSAGASAADGDCEFGYFQWEHDGTTYCTNGRPGMEGCPGVAKYDFEGRTYCEPGYEVQFTVPDLTLYDKAADAEVNTASEVVPLPLWAPLAGLGAAVLLLRRRR